MEGWFWVNLTPGEDMSSAEYVMPDSDATEERSMSQISAALAGWPGKGGLAMMQVVLSELSAQVAKWLLKDAPPVVQQQHQDIGLTGFETSSSMLNIQLAANWLAQRAG